MSLSGSLLVLMGPYSSLYVFVRFFESLWVLNCSYAYLCVFMGPFRSLGVLVDPTMSLLVFMRFYEF